MQADPRVGIELPLRMLIWQDPEGTHVGYLDPRELADRYALDGHQETLERQTACSPSWPPRRPAEPPGPDAPRADGRARAGALQPSFETVSLEDRSRGGTQRP